MVPVGPSATEVVQRLLAEVRQLKVDKQRLKDQIAELSARAGKPDPRLGSQEIEIRRLRIELAAAREQRDVVTNGLRVLADRIRALDLPG